MELGFRPVWVADFSAARSWPAPDSICPANFCPCRICFALGIVGSAVVLAAADFGLFRQSCPEIVETAAGPADSVRRRFAADLFSVVVAVEEAALVFVWGAVSTARFSF